MTLLARPDQPVEDGARLRALVAEWRQRANDWADKPAGLSVAMAWHDAADELDAVLTELTKTSRL